ncbi:hypothetical protein CHELA1G11_13702 [Hyphomicrobiales bacterium]|nr:hypothetical protein CHELA1G2_10613 [Hyphomicrobiales bacterium]CAH1673445.1 hypothetical protein CHELA1G11_13702 [Hyphomicrobiales bacterium]
MAALRKLDMKELYDFRDAMKVLGNVIAGIGCQPRFASESHRLRHNAAGELLEDLNELVAGYEQAAVNVAEAAIPSAAEDSRWRHWIMSGFAADMAEL